MKQYLVAIYDSGETFYRLVDDAEALDGLFETYGIWETGANYGITAYWKMLPPTIEEKLGTNLSIGLYPGAEIMPLKENMETGAIVYICKPENLSK